MIKAEFELNVTILVFKSLKVYQKRFLAKKCNEDYISTQIYFSYDLFIHRIISVTVILVTARIVPSPHPLAHTGPRMRNTLKNSQKLLQSRKFKQTESIYI